MPRPPIHCRTRAPGTRAAGPARLLALAALLSACAAGGVALEVPWLEAGEPVFLIEDADPELASQGSFALINRGTGAAHARLTVDGPLELVTPSLRIGPGEQARAVVRVHPDGTYAPRDGWLSVVTGFDALGIPVHITIDADVDDDGFLALAAGGEDCDDRNPRVHPGHPEVCDGLDNDCNGIIDDVQDPPVWYPDRDGDGYGDADAEPVIQCDRPAVGWVTNNDDCDDTRSDVYPGAPSLPDGLDNNCDGVAT